MSLEDAIKDHRERYAAELGIRMVARQPPTTIDPNTGEIRAEQANRMGPQMSGPLLRRIGHPEGYGQMFPWAKALWLLKVECRRSHPSHRAANRPYWRGSLCHEAVWAVVAGTRLGPLTPEQAAGYLKVGELDGVLRRSFRFIEDTMDDFRRKAEQKAKEDAGLFLLCRCLHSWREHDRPAERFTCGRCRCNQFEADDPRPEHHSPSDEHRAECPQCRRAA